MTTKHCRTSADQGALARPCAHVESALSGNRLVSRMAKKRKKRHGHYCWSCRRNLPNERFSGRGHQRHLCRTCSRLGKDELGYRQAVGDIEKCLGGNGQVRRRHRKTFDRFRHHPNERVRKYVEEIEDLWAEERRRWLELRHQDKEDLEALAVKSSEDGKPGSENRSTYDEIEDDEILF